MPNPPHRRSHEDLFAERQHGPPSTPSTTPTEQLPPPTPEYVPHLVPDTPRPAAGNPVKVTPGPLPECCDPPGARPADLPGPARWLTDPTGPGSTSSAETTGVPVPFPGGQEGYRNSSRAGPRGLHARPRRRRRPLRRAAVALLAALLVTSGGTYAWADTKLNRQVDLGAAQLRPAAGKGANYLIVGSDSRDGLSEGDKRDLHAGGGGGRRTDSMILLHTGAHGATMVSLPRDSWVTLPAFTNPRTGKRTGPAKNKLNAAFSLGGPRLLVRTVEHNTGLRIGHYAEIGFAGFVNIVNAVGGVRMCLQRDINDEKSGARLKKGCQVLDGRQALAFVRQRHQESSGDLGRSRNQQKFLSTLAHQAAQPGTLLNPTQLYPALGAGLDTLTVDQGMGMRELTAMLRSVRGVTAGRGSEVTIPVAGMGVPTAKGSVIVWDQRRARALFADLRADRPVRRGGSATPQ